MTLIWFVGDEKVVTFDPVSWWAGTLLLAIALDLSRQHAPQLGKTPRHE